MHKILEEKVAVVYQMEIKYGKKDKRKEMKCREDKTKSSVKDLQQPTSEKLVSEIWCKQGQRQTKPSS